MRRRRPAAASTYGVSFAHRCDGSSNRGWQSQISFRRAGARGFAGGGHRHGHRVRPRRWDGCTSESPACLPYSSSGKRESGPVIRRWRECWWYRSGLDPRVPGITVEEDVYSQRDRKPVEQRLQGGTWRSAPRDQTPPPQEPPAIQIQVSPPGGHSMYNPPVGGPDMLLGLAAGLPA